MCCVIQTMEGFIQWVFKGNLPFRRPKRGTSQYQTQSGVNPTKHFFFVNAKFFHFFAVKLGQSIDNTIVFLYYKHSRLRAKIRKPRNQSLVGSTPGCGNELITRIKRLLR